MFQKLCYLSYCWICMLSWCLHLEPKSDDTYFFSAPALPTVVLTCIHYGQGKWSNQFNSRPPSTISTATNSMCINRVTFKRNLRCFCFCHGMLHVFVFPMQCVTLCFSSFFLSQVFLLWAYKKRLQRLTAVPSQRSSLLQVRNQRACV